MKGLLLCIIDEIMFRYRIERLCDQVKDIRTKCMKKIT